MLKRIQEGYFADQNGNIYSNRKYKKITLIKQHKDKKGYYRIKLLGKTKKVHRIIGETFIPNPLKKETINHKDGNKANNKISNLEWSSRSENTKHAYDTGLKIGYKGRKKSRIGITKKLSSEWYRLNKNGLSLREIAKLYKVNHHTIKLNIIKIKELRKIK